MKGTHLIGQFQITATSDKHLNAFLHRMSKTAFVP